MRTGNASGRRRDTTPQQAEGRRVALRHPDISRIYGYSGLAPLLFRAVFPWFLTNEIIQRISNIMLFHLICEISVACESDHK